MSLPPEARYVPSGENEMAATSRSCPVNRVTSRGRAGSATSHSRSTPSVCEVAIRVPWKVTA
ncbi:hypothetical protein [Lentzea flava]|uniref:hypothetical protein n=1 Tax=Lentzea flava TaxID=103732 RepID=UPI001E521FF4|nr:hypothetical protein [Lentzea flava]